MPPLDGSAAAETSAMARLAHPVLEPAAAASAVFTVEQPEPAPLQTYSVQPRVVPEAANSDVPPTAVT
ncbi:hypothetical protein BH10ACT10_BH10ACT10_14520 [soil metagenome]